MRNIGIQQLPNQCFLNRKHYQRWHLITEFKLKSEYKAQGSL